MNGQALDHGRLLYRLLPGIFRTRDQATTADGRPGDLSRYLAALGELLDRIQGTLEQMRLDSFPDPAQDAERSQDWVLPYIAQLLDVKLAADEAQGQREEITRAVEWHQRKGTLPVLTEIAAIVGNLEVQVQEGWQRVALAPRINEPVLPASRPAESEVAQSSATVTVDVRREARAVALDPANQDDPTARYGHFSGQEVLWRPMNPEGVPRFPDSYQDVSRRTVDMRTPAPNVNQGHVHPGRVVLYSATPPAPGSPRYHALLHKLKDFLPVGIEVWLVRDATLPDPPPALGAATADQNGTGGPSQQAPGNRSQRRRNRSTQRGARS